MKVILLLISILTLNGYTQSEIRGVLKDFEAAPTMLYLHKAIKGGTSLIDSCKISKKGRFDLTVNDSTSALYYLFIDKISHELIINSNDKKLGIECSYSSFLKGDFILKGSSEHQPFTIFNQIESNYMAKVNQFISANYISSIDTLAKTKKQLYNRQLENYLKERNIALLDLMNTYPNSFVSEVLARLTLFPLNDGSLLSKDVFDNDKAFLHHHYLDFINFEDERITTIDLYASKIENYLSKYSDFSFGRYASSIHTIMQKASANIEVYDYTLNFIIEFFAQRHQEEILSYLLQNYAFTYKSKLSTNTLQKIENFDGTIEGMPIDNLPTMALYGNKSNLHKLCKGSAYNLVVFWDGMANLDVLSTSLNALKQNHDNFELIGFSLNTDKSQWKNNLDQLQLPWIHVSSDILNRQAIINQFRIKSLPHLILLDTDARIIKINPSFEQLKTMLQASKGN